VTPRSVQEARDFLDRRSPPWSKPDAAAMKMLINPHRIASRLERRTEIA
jgi:hypothetical protein